MKRPIEHRTLDGGRIAPYPGMTDEELDDFEEWAAPRISTATEYMVRLYEFVAIAVIVALWWLAWLWGWL